MRLLLAASAAALLLIQIQSDRRATYQEAQDVVGSGDGSSGSLSGGDNSGLSGSSGSSDGGNPSFSLSGTSGSADNGGSGDFNGGSSGNNLVGSLSGTSGSAGNDVSGGINGANSGSDLSGSLSGTSGGSDSFNGGSSGSISGTISDSGNLGGQISGSSGGSLVSTGSGSIGPFTYRDSALLSYSSAAQRDTLLQALLTLFQKTYGSLGINNLKIKLINEVKGAANGATQVFYEITGQSWIALDIFAIFGNFQGLLSKGAVRGATSIPTAFSAAGQNVADVSGASIQSGSSFSMADKVLLTYNTDAERDNLLQQLLKLAQSLFGAYGLSNIQITFLGEAPGANGAQQVLYRFSATASSAAVDVNGALATLHTSISASKLVGVANIDSGSGNTAAVVNAGGSIGAFQYSDSALLSYGSSAQRDTLLNGILSLFQKTYSVLGLSSLKIVSTKELTGAANGATRIFYSITGQATIALDNFAIFGNFQSLLSKGAIRGVTALPTAFSLNGQIVADISGGWIQSGNSFVVGDKVLLTYSTDADRDVLVQQIQKLAVNVLAGFGLSNIKLALLGEAPGSNGDQQTLYEISATASSATVDASGALAKLHDAIASANIKGVSNIDGPTTTTVAPVVPNTGAFAYTDSAIFTYTTVEQGNALLVSLLNLFQQSYGASYGISGLTIAPIKAIPAANGATQITYTISGQASKSIDLSLILSNFQNTIAKGSISGVALLPSVFTLNGKVVYDISGVSVQNGKDFSVGDKALLKYTSVAQRDALLAQIQKLAVASFASIGLSNVQIVYLGEAPGFNGATQVLYKFVANVNVASGPAISVASALDAIHASIDSGTISGISNIVLNFGGDVSGGINGIISAGNIGGSSLSVGPFSFSDSVLLTFTSTAERDALLQKLLVLFTNNYASIGFSGLKIEWVRDVSRSNGATLVVYKISGQSTKVVNLSWLLTTFQNQIRSSLISGISLVSTGFTNNGVSIGNIAGTVTISGSVFSLFDSALLTFNTIVDRDSLLNQILIIANNALAPFGVSKLNIAYLGQSAATNGAVQVLYVITGQAAKSFDVSTIITTIHSGITSSRINGIANVVTTLVNGFLAVGSNVATDAYNVVGSVISIAGGWWKNLIANGNSGASDLSIGVFTYSDSVLLTYSTVDQRNSLLVQVLKLFVNKYSAAYGLSGLDIFYLADITGGNGQTQVSYKIVGNAAAKINLSWLILDFQSYIKSSAISAITIVSSGFVDADNGNAVVSAVAGSVSVSGSVFTLYDSVLLTFSTTAQRDAKLLRLLSLFNDALSIYGLSNLKVAYIGQTPGPNGAFQVLYQFTGQTSRQFSVDSLFLTTRQITISNARIPGISNVVLNLVNGVLNVAGVVVNNVVNIITNLGGAISGGFLSLISGGNVGGSAASVGVFSYTDSAVLTFSSNSRRDGILQEILSVFSGVYSSVGLTNLKIVYVSTLGTSNGQSQVQYKITGQATRPINLNWLLASFQNRLKSLVISGLSAVSAGFSADGSAITGVPGAVISSGSIFSFFDSALLTFSSVAQRDSLLQQIKGVVKTSFAAYGLSNLDIAYLGQSATSTAGSFQVLYLVTGQVTKQFDILTILLNFHNSLTSAGLRGIQVVVYTFANGVISIANGIAGGISGGINGLVNGGISGGINGVLNGFNNGISGLFGGNTQTQSQVQRNSQTQSQSNAIFNPFGRR